MSRRQQIVEAAADLLRDGDGKLTHRLVADRAAVPLGSTTYYFSSLDDLVAAALEHLAAQVDADLAETAATIAASDGTPEAIAAAFHEYLSDQDRVRTETALYIAAVTRPELIDLSRRWFDGIVEVLTDLTDRDSARLMAVFLDGACMHAAINDTPLELPLLEGLSRTLMSPSADTIAPEAGRS